MLTVGACTCLSDDPAGLDEIRGGLDLALSRGCVQEVGRGYNSLSRWLAYFGRHDAVIDLEAEALERCANAGIARVYGPAIELGVIRSLCRLGRWRDVEQRVADLADEFEGLQLEHFTLADSWGLVLVRQGRLENVADFIAATFEHLSGHHALIGPSTVTAVELAAAENRVAEISGLVDTALERIEPNGAGCAETGLPMRGGWPCRSGRRSMHRTRLPTHSSDSPTHYSDPRTGNRYRPEPQRGPP